MRSLQTQNIFRASPIGACCWLIVCVVSSSSSFAQQTPGPTQLPTGARVVAGQVGIQQSGASMNVTQTSTRGVVDWATFNIGSSAQVKFIQPSTSSVTLNRVLDSNPSQIFGNISSNGQVFLTNPNGLFFSPMSSVDVGGLVATTMKIGTDDFMSGINKFKSADGLGLVLNQGRLTASDGGYISLLAPQVRNEGVIIARLGSVAFASGNAVTLQLSDKSLVKVQVDEGVINGLIENKSLVKADGGLVVMSAKAANSLVESVIQNSGTIRAQTIENQSGRILLIGDMSSGKLNVDGTLDASAPAKGDGGFIETSAAKVKVANSTVVTTKAQQGKTGKWLVDPHDYTVASSGGDQTGAQLSAALESTNVELQSANGSQVGSGDVNINDPVVWSANTKLTLTASNNINVNANIVASGYSAGLVINPNTTNQNIHNSTETSSGSGAFKLGVGSSIGLPNVAATSQAALVVAGVPYIVINSLGSEGSLTGLDLQGINGNLIGNYALGRSIDASSTQYWNLNSGFLSIGSAIVNGRSVVNGDGFTGKFIGLGNSIDGMLIKRPVDDYIGLFSRISSSSVRYLNLKNFDISGSNFLGGLSGEISASQVDGVNVYSTLLAQSGSQKIGGLTGSALGSDVSNSSSSGQINIDGNSSKVGGFIGFLQSSRIEGNYSNMEISSSGAASMVGGLIGHSEMSLISGNYSTGSINISDRAEFVGGGVGNFGFVNDIDNNYSLVNIVVGSSSINVGGYSGYLGWGSQIYFSYSAGRVVAGQGSVSIGGFLGDSIGYTQGTFWNLETSGQSSSSSSSFGFNSVGLTSQQMKSWSTFSNDGWNSSNFYSSWQNMWGIYSGVNSGFPVFNSKVIIVKGLSGESTYGQSPLVSYKFVMSNGVSSNGLNFEGSPIWQVEDQSNFQKSNLTALTKVNQYSLSYKEGLSTFGGYYLISDSSAWRVTPALLTINGVFASNKEYDSTAIANVNVSSAALNGVIAGDAVSLDVSGVVGSFANKNVGSTKLVTVTGHAISGNDAANYNLVQPTGLTADITKADLQVAGVAAQTKVYDTTRVASLTGTATATPLGVDDVTVGGTGAGQFSDKNVGTGKAVAVTGYTISGTDAGNYNVVQPIGVTADITKADLQVAGVAAQTKVYDTTRVASLTGTATATPLGVDDVTVGGTGAGQFSDKNVGTGKSVAVTGYTISGTDAGNYNVVQPTSLTADISKADLQVTGVSAINKMFDATKDAILTGAARVTPLGSDDVILSGSGVGQYANKTPGISKAIAITGYSILGSDAGNYTLHQPSGVLASIVAKDERFVTEPAQSNPQPVAFESTFVTMSGERPELNIGVPKKASSPLMKIELAPALGPIFIGSGAITMTTLDGNPPPPSIVFDQKTKSMTVKPLSLTMPVNLVLRGGDQILQMKIFFK